MFRRPRRRRGPSSLNRPLLAANASCRMVRGFCSGRSSNALSSAIYTSWSCSVRQPARCSHWLGPSIPNCRRLRPPQFDLWRRASAQSPLPHAALLQRILQEPRFTVHAHEEAPRLAEGIGDIIPHDPEFAAIVYATLFGRSAPQEGTSWLGGHRSRILPLSSNRKQDYEYARWHLARALKPFLEADPKAGVTAVIGAALGLAAQDSPRRRQEPETLRIAVGAHALQVVDDLLSLQDWRQRGRRTGDPEDDVLGTFVDFLRTANTATFRTAVEVALDTETGTAVWSRLLGVAAERVGVAEALLWPLVVQPMFVSVRGLRATPLSTSPPSIRPGCSTSVHALKQRPSRPIYFPERPHEIGGDPSWLAFCRSSRRPRWQLARCGPCARTSRPRASSGRSGLPFDPDGRGLDRRHH